MSAAWDADGNGSLSESEEAAWQVEKTSFMTQYIAVNHPNSMEEEGYDFVGYDWNYSRAFAFDAESKSILTSDCASDPSQQCLIPLDLQANQGGNAAYVMTGARWYEDFPFLDLSMMQLGNGIEH